MDTRTESTDSGEPPFAAKTREVSTPEFGMPGPYPGRVIEIRNPNSVSEDDQILAAEVPAMVDRGMTALTGADEPISAWRRLFQRGDIVGIKVNPVGYARAKGIVGAISQPAVLISIVENLKRVGIPTRDIIVFERYATEFREAGYEAVLRERVMDGVRWYASSSGFDEAQLDIEGHGPRRVFNRDSHVVGYDPDAFVHLGFATPGYEKDERCFRSHLSLIVTRMVNKIITIPVLKDHRSAGVTLALKNLSHGLNNNVARSHIADVYGSGRVRSGTNQCNTFIPSAAGQEAIREKATLHILDGLIGVYEGGPGNWNSTWGTWRRGSLFFATDPVAMDHVGWEIIDAKRVAEGWPSVAHMGQLLPEKAKGEQFDRRQPEHILLAGTVGLGVFDAHRIEHRVIDV
jgi:uncharacterized protein (DUF362 family)